MVSAVTGILALCLALGFGAAAVGAAFLSDSGVVAFVCGFCGFCFFFVAVMLLRRANEQWGWRE